MNYVHIIYNEETKKFMVDYDEVARVNENNREDLKEFLYELNSIETKISIKVPWWYWVYTGLFISAIPILIVFCWPVIVGLAGLFIVLSIFVFMINKRHQTNFRKEVNVLCEKYRTKFGNKFYLTNYFNKDLFPPEEHDYEGLAILLFENNRTGLSSVENVELINSIVHEDNQERISRTQFRESRKSRPSKRASESFVPIGNFIQSDTNILTQENLGDVGDEYMTYVNQDNMPEL